MADFLGRKVIISASKLLKKAWLGSKVKRMVLNIVTEQMKETRFLRSQGPIYQIWMGSHLQKSKDGRKMPKMQMAAFFVKSLLSQLLQYLESHVWGQN